MSDYMVTGKTGEDLAVSYLADLGLQVLSRNWRYRRTEIDIIATSGDVLHIVEVKTRTTVSFGLPEESVTRKKIRTLFKAGTAYLARNPGWKNIQYDIISILLTPGEKPEFFYIKDISL